MNRRAKALWILAVAMAVAGVLLSRLRLPGPRHTAGSGESFRPMQVDDPYLIHSSEPLLYLPSVSEQVRRNTYARLAGSIPDLPIVSLSVAVGDQRSVQSVEFGYAYVPRSLLAVLTDTLRIEAIHLGDVSSARDIPLPGDWVVNAKATTESRLRALETAVQNATGRRIGFSLARSVRPLLLLSGDLQSNAKVISILNPLGDVATSPPTQSGDLNAFCAALNSSLAIVARLDGVSAPTATVRWIDHAHVYRQLGVAVPPNALECLKSAIESATGLRATIEETLTDVWSMEEPPR